MKIVDKLAVLGLGLIGGSVLRGAVERGLAAEVAGWDVSTGALEAARAAGFASHLAPSLEGACRGADLAVVAVPVGSIPPLVDRARRLLPAGAAVTDTGSAKGWVLEEVARLEAAGAAASAVAAAGTGGAGATPGAGLPVFVGGHPMAGAHASGFGSSRADLLAGASWIIVPPGEAGRADAGTGRAAVRRGPAPEAAAAVELVAALARGLGAHPVVSSAAEHDRRLALTSHLPYLLALALEDLAGRDGGPEDLAPYTAGGFRDATRLALQEPAMGCDFLMANAQEVGAALAALTGAAGALLGAVARPGGGDAAGRTRAGLLRAWREELGRVKRWE